MQGPVKHGHHNQKQSMEEMIHENSIIKEKVKVWNEKQKLIKTKNEMNDKIREEKQKKGLFLFRISNCLRCKSVSHSKKKILETEEHHR